MIKVVDVTQHYGVRPVLRQVNLQVERGEVLALMGPNGVGKSTLLAAIAGALSPQYGYVEIDGKRRRSSVENELAIRKLVVYLPAQPWLPLHVTGREYLMAVGRLYGIDDLRLMDHVDRSLRLFQLSEKGDAPIRSYSTGQRKKIGLCAALVTEATVLLLDEPFAGGLDPSGIHALKTVLQRLAQRTDVTIVMATPVPELVEELADRIAVMCDGQIVACDTLSGLQRSTGCPGHLGPVVESLVNPNNVQDIEQYFNR